MRLALAQINAVVGDLDGNRERILAALTDAREASADIVLLPELAVTGYPPEDLLLRPAFVRAAEESLRAIAAATTGLIALVGTPWFDRDLFNACAAVLDGELKALYRKRFLPNYGVFDEERYFAPGRELLVLPASASPHRLVTICEDIWQPGPPATDLALAGAELLVNLSASPYHVGKAEDREEMLVDAGPRQLAAYSPSATSSAARTSWSSTVTPSCSTTRARSSHARPASRRRCSSSSSTERGDREAAP